MRKALQTVDIRPAVTPAVTRRLVSPHSDQILFAREPALESGSFTDSAGCVTAFLAPAGLNAGNAQMRSIAIASLNAQ